MTERKKEIQIKKVKTIITNLIAKFKKAKSFPVKAEYCFCAGSIYAGIKSMKNKLTIKFEKLFITVKFNNNPEVEYSWTRSNFIIDDFSSEIEQIYEEC
jgi:hypothetical protein